MTWPAEHEARSADKEQAMNMAIHDKLLSACETAADSFAIIAEGLHLLNHHTAAEAAEIAEKHIRNAIAEAKVEEQTMTAPSTHTDQLANALHDIECALQQLQECIDNAGPNAIRIAAETVCEAITRLERITSFKGNLTIVSHVARVVVDFARGYGITSRDRQLLAPIVTCIREQINSLGME
jgi:hypothetical protein